ncbi:TIR domain-containing protein [Sorangium sp. So ce260]|uniref:TIR domain-containing protein n=1 Tax=Sorangium sp. So ce260 TaxID=3133291 RepID=UPI003F5FE083
MPAILHSQILRVHAAAVEVGLPAKRGALLAGLPRDLVATLPDAPSPDAQLLSDLDHLNHHSRLPDGSVPLEIWLTNALALCGYRHEAEVVRELLALINAPRAVPGSAVAHAAVPAPGTTGGSTYHINIQGSTIGALGAGNGAVISGMANVRSGAPSGSAQGAPAAQPTGASTHGDPGTKTATTSHFQSIYLSYGDADLSFTRRLHEGLEARGVPVFFREDHAPGGEKHHRTARKGINDCDRVLLVCSQRSLTDQRVLNELEETLAREARQGGAEVVIPVRLDSFVTSRWNPPTPDVVYPILDRYIINFEGTEHDPIKYAKCIDRLTGALQVVPGGRDNRPLGR